MSETITQAVPATEEKYGKHYKMRDLQAQDIFIMSKIISAIGIEEFKIIFNADYINSITQGLKGDENDVASAVGIEMFFEIAGVILKNLPKCENDIYAFIAGLTDIPAEEIKQTSMPAFANIIIDIIKKDEFKDFIRVVSQLFK